MDLTRSNSPEFWNSLAKPCSHYERKSAYAAEFLQKSGIRAGESVFDMGCGSGTLCLPLADEGHEVFCADFSAGMLQSVTDTVEEEGITKIRTRLLSWQEPWPDDLPVCDLAFASRCLFDADPEDAVRKLSSHAARKVCITLPVNSGMFHGTITHLEAGLQGSGNCPGRKEKTDLPGEPESSSAKYEIGDADFRTAYLLQVLSAVFRQGYYPELSYMTGRSGGKGWAFVSWETEAGT